MTEYERFGLVFTKTQVYKFEHCGLTGRKSLNTLKYWTCFTNECGCVGALEATPSPSLAGSVIIYAKTTAHCSPGSSTVAGIKLTYTGWGEGRVGPMRRQQTNAWSSTTPFATFPSSQEYSVEVLLLYIASSGTALVLHLGVEKWHRASESASWHAKLRELRSPVCSMSGMT